MTETTPEQTPSRDWDGFLDQLRRRFPGNRDSTLFCIFKLQQNPDLGLRDLRAEADLHGLTLAGRSLHTARVLLGIEPAKTTAPAKAAPPAPAARKRVPARAEANGSIEDKVIAAVRQIQDAAGLRSQRLRTAITKAIAILQQALDDG